MVKIVAFVPIKLKSERLPNKMLLNLGEKKLCQYIFDVLLQVKKTYNIDIYCYCSDASLKDYLPHDVIFLKRSTSLDGNEVKGIQIYNEFAKQVKSDIYILCHATSPFISKDSIIKGIDKVVNENYDSSFSCSKVQTFCWYDGKTLNYSLDDVVRTQEIKPLFWETSAFYIFKKDILDNGRRIGNRPFLVETDLIESIDIDEQKDYELAVKIVNN